MEPGDDNPLEDDEELELRETDVKLAELEGRIERLKGPEHKGNRQFAQGVALVLSMGFVIVGCLFAGLLLGDYLVERTGYKVFQLVGLVTGLGTALFAGVKLMKPLMKSNE